MTILQQFICQNLWGLDRTDVDKKWFERHDCRGSLGCHVATNVWGYWTCCVPVLRFLVLFPGVNLKESPERPVESVSSQHRQQGGHLFGGRSSGLPGQHADVPMPDQLARHHRERRRDPSKRLESGGHTGGLQVRFWHSNMTFHIFTLFSGNFYFCHF